MSGIVFIAFGIILIGNNMDLFHINMDSFWSLLWPVILILVGINLVFGKKGNQFDIHLHLGIYVDTPFGELSVNPYYILKYFHSQ